MKYFGNISNIKAHQFLVKDLFKAKDNKLVNNIKDALIDLRNAIIIEANPENENPNKITDIVGKTHNFNKQQKGNIKTLSPKQILQRLPIVLAQVIK